MKDHMEVPIDTSNMSEQELQFHYFKMHDADGNNKLDGCELVKSLIHWHGEETEHLKFIIISRQTSRFQTKPITTPRAVSQSPRPRFSRMTSWST